jgi:uncharacterized protein YjbJ (UPF0337 family)
MTMTENTIKGKWLEIRGDIQKAWGKLTNDELDKTQGDIKAISGLIQQRYGEAQDTYRQKVSDIFKRFEVKTQETVETVKSQLKK